MKYLILIVLLSGCGGGNPRKDRITESIRDCVARCTDRGIARFQIDSFGDICLCNDPPRTPEQTRLENIDKRTEYMTIQLQDLKERVAELKQGNENVKKKKISRSIFCLSNPSFTNGFDPGMCAPSGFLPE